jgi:iron(III) transport system substrate-binding protein
LKTSQCTLTLMALMASLLLTACASAASSQAQPQLTIYSGRSESLVGPIITQFEAASGIKVAVRWGSTAELAATLLEEGERSPADLFFAQDPGGLGAVTHLLAGLPEGVLQQVPQAFRDSQGRWVGISGRARVVVYNTDQLTAQDLPADIWDFTAPTWNGHLGWAPTNASFQTMVSAMRASWGEAKTRQWLEGIQANLPVVYDNNTAIVAAVAAGEVQAGFVNHYYLYRFLQEEGDDFPARNYFQPGGGPGSLVMVSGAGILETSQNREAAVKFLDFLLSPVAQQYFTTQTYEYPVVEGVIPPRELPDLNTLHQNTIDVAALADIQGSVSLLRETGILP